MRVFFSRSIPETATTTTKIILFLFEKIDTSQASLRPFLSIDAHQAKISCVKYTRIFTQREREKKAHTNTDIPNGVYIVIEAAITQLYTLVNMTVCGVCLVAVHVLVCVYACECAGAARVLACAHVCVRACVCLNSKFEILPYVCMVFRIYLSFTPTTHTVSPHIRLPKDKPSLD